MTEPAAFAQGYRWERSDATEVSAVVDAAFDYRGDVTLVLEGGETIVGYVSNRDRRGADPFLDLLPADGGPLRRVPYQLVRSIEISGKDTASGKSWETWVRTWQAKKAAAAGAQPTDSRN